MSNFLNAKIVGDVELDLTKFGNVITEKVSFSGAATMASVIYAEVKLNASPPRMGRETGKLMDSIYWVYSPEKSSDTLKTYRISWNKKKAPHGHLIEFGTSRAPAHPFIRPALSRIPDAIAQGKARMAQRLAEET